MYVQIRWSGSRSSWDMWAEREDCPYVNKTYKTVLKIIMNNSFICSLSYHNIINKVLRVDHSAMLVLARDSQGNSKSTLWRPSTEVNI